MSGVVGGHVGKAEHYAELLASVVKEAAASAPVEWSAGALTIGIVGKTIRYALKNPDEPRPATITPELRKAVMAYYNAMADGSDRWLEARITFRKSGDGLEWAVAYDRALPPEPEGKGKFWSGPIASTAQAERIIKISSVVFFAFAGLAMLPVIDSLTKGRIDPGAIILVLLFGLLSGCLGIRKSRIAALLLMAICALTTAVSIAVTFSALNGAWNVPVLALFPLVAFWALLGYIAWRGFQGARAYWALRKFAPEPVLAAFD